VIQNIELSLFWAAVVAYAVSGVLIGYMMAFDRQRLWRYAAPVLVAGFIAHTVSLVLRWVVTGHVPTIGNYENGSIAGWFIMAFVLWFALRRPEMRLAAALAIPVAVITMGVGLMADTGEVSPMVASLRSWWLYVHIFFAWAATGALSFASGAAVLLLIRDSKLKKGEALTEGGLLHRLPSEDKIDELIYRNIVLGFIAYVAMIASGALWAKDLWGAYWSWDPVETWSLVSWMVYGLILHMRFTFGWRGVRMAWLVVLALLTVFLTMFGVNFAVESSMHIFNVR